MKKIQNNQTRQKVENTKHIPQPEITKLKEEIIQLKNGWRRTQADWENFRRRSEEDRKKIIQFANLDFLEKLFPVMDNFRRASLHIPQDLQSHDWIKGVLIIEKQLEAALAEEGLEKIEPKAGEEFDPQFHEAISSEENKNYRSNQIIALLEVGYKLADKVVRPAKVRVAK